MNIDLLSSTNRYNVVSHFLKSIASAMMRLGHTTRTFPVTKELFYKAYYAIHADPPDFTFSFDLRVDRRPFALYSPSPHVTCLVDPVLFSLSLLQIPRSIITCIDEEEVSYARSLGFSHALFLPHGVEKSLLEKENNEEKEIDLIFFGSCIDYEKVKRGWRKKLSEKEISLLEEICEKVLSDPASSLLSELLNADVGKRLSLLFIEGDKYVTGKDRASLLRTLAPFSPHVYGAGPWEGTLDRAHIHPPLAFSKALSLMGKAKIVVNSSPRFKRGLHERILYGGAVGALPLTTETPFLLSHFDQGKEILTYRFHEREKLQEEVNELLNHPSRRDEMVHSFRKKLIHHTWDERAAQLLSFLSFHDTNSPC